MSKDRIILISVNLCRFFLAAVFIFSGFIKANDPLGTVYKIQDYLEAWSLYSLNGTIFPYTMATLLAIFEFVVGINLLFGIRRRLTPVLLNVFMAVMTLLTLWLALYNPIKDCGCFGDVVVLTNWETFFKNIILLAASVVVLKNSRKMTRLVTGKVDWLISLYSFVFIIFFTIYCYRRLPVFDFRPFKIGTDIVKAMEIPEGAKRTEFETIFVCEKDGVQQKFTADNYPTDSAWVFVSAETEVKEQGYEPPIQDFCITSPVDGEDITGEVLSDENYSFLLIAPWLSKADDSEIDLINEVYDYSVDNGYRFLCLTASNDADIELWRDNTGAEYPFAIMDEITLKTIVRSSPGLVLLRKGVILNKWSNMDLPDEYVLTAPLNKLEIGRVNRPTLMYKVVLVLGWFVLPFLSLTLIDVIWRLIQNLLSKRKKVSE